MAYIYNIHFNVDDQEDHQYSAATATTKQTYIHCIADDGGDDDQDDGKVEEEGDVDDDDGNYEDDVDDEDDEELLVISDIIEYWIVGADS